MKIEKLNNTNNTNFKRLYMPTQATLKKYGANFAKEAESQRSALKEFAKNYDIYLIPRYKNQDKELFKKMREGSNGSQNNSDTIIKQGSYFNAYITAKFPRIIKSLNKRVSFGVSLYGALGVEPKSILYSLNTILRNQEAKNALDELNKFYKTLS